MREAWDVTTCPVGVTTPVLILRVSRKNILEDTLANFAKIANPQLWTCALRVIFEDEDGKQSSLLVTLSRVVDQAIMRG